MRLERVARHDIPANRFLPGDPAAVSGSGRRNRFRLVKHQFEATLERDCVGARAPRPGKPWMLHSRENGPVVSAHWRLFCFLVRPWWLQTGLVLLSMQRSLRLRGVHQQFGHVLRRTQVLLLVRLACELLCLMRTGRPIHRPGECCVGRLCKRFLSHLPSARELQHALSSPTRRRLGVWAAVAATIPAVATGGSAEGLTVSHNGVAEREPSELQRSREPVPLGGVPLRGDTGLRLVVSDNPPLVLDVDTGSATPLLGVPAMNRGVLWVVGVAGRAAVVVAQSAPDANVYAVRGRGAPVSYLGTGRNVWPARAGRAVWIQSFVNRSHCTLRQVGLNGQQIRAPRAFPCATGSDPAAGSLGLVVHRTRVIDPLTGRTVLKTRWGILAAAGEKLVLAGPGRQFTLLDAATSTQRRLRWPSILPGLDQPAVDPRGRLVALAFAVPSWGAGGQQVLDVWLLDAETGKLTQLPGMPAFVSLKFTNMAWTHDGRLVLLAESSGKELVAIWRPGQQRLALKTVHLRERIGGSDTFAPVG